MARAKDTKGNTSARVGNYIPFGSSDHAQILGIREAESFDETIIEDSDGKKWAHKDVTVFGPAATKEFLGHVLAKRVRVLKSTPSAPPNSPEMWTPEIRKPTSQQEEYEMFLAWKRQSGYA